MYMAENRFGTVIIVLLLIGLCIGVVGAIEPMPKPPCYKHITCPISQTVEHPLYDISALKSNQMRCGI